MPSVSSRTPAAAASSDFIDVTNVSQTMNAMAAGQLYRLCSSIDTWVAVGTAPTAAAANGSIYLPANQELFIRCVATDDLVAVLRVGAANGVATLTVVDT